MEEGKALREVFEVIKNYRIILFDGLFFLKNGRKTVKGNSRAGDALI